jgi:glycosyltransferase involved in cell wall biosynthesis
MAKVSVIIPLYNYARFLDEAIQSLLEQTRPADEIIIVDDCSTDNPKPIIDKYPQIKYIKHDKNRGLAVSRNTGIKASVGDYIMSFDADDILKPRAIEEHLKLMGDNVIATCGLMAFGDESYTATPETATLEILLKRNCIYSNSMFTKKLWEKVGGFDESDIMRKGLEDWEFWIRCAEKGAVFKTSLYVALLWRRHGNSMSSTSANPNWDILMAYFKEKHKHLI